MEYNKLNQPVALQLLLLSLLWPIIRAHYTFYKLFFSLNKKQRPLEEFTFTWKKQQDIQHFMSELCQP